MLLGYEKTICVYRSLKLPRWLGKVWNVLEQGERGLTCRGDPRERGSEKRKFSNPLYVCLTPCGTLMSLLLSMNYIGPVI